MTAPLSNSSVNQNTTYNKMPMESYSLNQRYLAYAKTCKEDSFNLQNETQYYNDPEKENKKKIKGRAIIASALVATGAIAATFIGAKAGNVNISKLLSQGKVEAKGLFAKIGSALSNVNNVKDDLLERLADTVKQKNIPVVKHLADYCRGTKNFYRSILKKSPLKASYENAAKILKKEGIEVQDFEKWFNSLDEAVLETLKTSNNGNHFTKGIFNKDLFTKMTTNNIADDVLIKNDKFKQLAGNITVQEGKQLSKEAQQALQNLNKSRNKITAKLRDINAGSAATDFITDAVSLASLGVAVKLADNKEEKKSIATELGLPLVSALGCAFIGNLMAIAGAPCMIFGFAIGQVAKTIAKAVTKSSSKELVNNRIEAHQG